MVIKLKIRCPRLRRPLAVVYLYEKENVPFILPADMDLQFWCRKCMDTHDIHLGDLNK